MPLAIGLGDGHDSGVEVEDDDLLYDDGGSSFINSSGLSSTTSLASSIKNYQYENGRRYHGFKEGIYTMPNDEQEQSRLELHHHIHRLKLDGHLYRSPIRRGVSSILDLGTGTGTWAVEVADMFPEAQVIGNDLSPIQSPWVPPNLSFEIDDFESDWTHEIQFDFIHARDLQGSVSNYDRLVNQAYDHLNPGGWFEFAEVDLIVCGDDDTIHRAKALQETTRLVKEASAKMGRVMGTATEHRRRLANAGFVNIREDIYKMPWSPWPKDPKLKELGKYYQVNMLESLDAYSLALLTRVLNWPVEDVHVLLDAARAELLDRSIHTYAKWFHVYGQKPRNV
ncbi:putative TAM domain methyltransferase [Aspergillus steynii IBT 23096]|uniref:Putative TAM domain methyltransferase n=1 Tax=Aspergillus steynii IBT 23096 TaxID=1392250 RepID=A0A2I2GEW6_9EURO|nr:putative TAM domain methyltransferase [Aspergillus steynii IBT 23096]PLB51433.1 putative TAM domain methyltransferase [Aspergillus steynii IBT 23096]